MLLKQSGTLKIKIYSWFVDFNDLFGRNIPILANFKLPRWHQWTGNWKEMLRTQLLGWSELAQHTAAPKVLLHTSVTTNSDLSYQWIVWVIFGKNQYSTILGIHKDLIKNFSCPWSKTSTWKPWMPSVAPWPSCWDRELLVSLIGKMSLALNLNWPIFITASQMLNFFCFSE